LGRRESVKGRLALFVAGAVFLAGCSIGNQWPGDPTPGPGHALLVIGDSLAGQTDVTLADVLAREGLPTVVIDAHQNGSGLIGPVGDAPTALEYVKAQVAAYPEADTVLLEWAGACAVCGKTIDGTTYPALGDTAAGFYDLWRTNAHAIIDYLHDQGKVVVWAVSPPMGTTSDTAASGSSVGVGVSQILSWIDRTEFAPATVGDVNWYTALSTTDGNYATSLFYDGTMHQVRTDDLTHFTLDGSTRASRWTAKGLGDLWATLPPPPLMFTQNSPGLVEAGDPVTLNVGFEP
jgi:hypothetical protein